MLRFPVMDNKRAATKAARLWSSALEDDFENASDLSEDELPENRLDYFAHVFDRRNVVTETERSANDVRLLRRALLVGDDETNRPALPDGVVLKILDAARYWCTVEKRYYQPFNGGHLDVLCFKFGPIPGKPKRVSFRARTRDQGWSIHPQNYGQYNSCTHGHVDIKDAHGCSKLGGRQRLFTNRHAVKKWQVRTITFDEGEGLMQHLAEGDTLEFYFKAECQGWSIYVDYARMVLFYEPHFKDTPSDACLIR